MENIEPEQTIVCSQKKTSSVGTGTPIHTHNFPPTTSPDCKINGGNGKTEHVVVDKHD